MKKEFFGVRTEFKDDLRRAKGILGLPTLTDTFESIMRSIAEPHLPQSASILKALERKEEKPEDDCCFTCGGKNCLNVEDACHTAYIVKEDAEHDGACSDCKPCLIWDCKPPTPKGTDQP